MWWGPGARLGPNSEHAVYACRRRGKANSKTVFSDIKALESLGELVLAMEFRLVSSVVGQWRSMQWRARSRRQLAATLLA